MERTRATEQESESRVKQVANAVAGLFKRSRGENFFPAWVDDRLGYWPVNDRGGAMSEYQGPGDKGMLGVMARIEMNEEDGRPLDSGLPPDALRPRR